MSFSNRILSSRQNDRVKFLVKLRDRKTRDRFGMFLIEGLKELDCALEHSVELDTLYYCPDCYTTDGSMDFVERVHEAGFTTQEVTKEVFEKISFRDNPDGLLACAKAEPTSLENLELSPNPLILVIEGIEKPANLGNILRTAEAAGVDAIVITGQGTDIYNPNVIRASRGLVFGLPIVQTSNQQTHNFLNKNNIAIFATSPRATLSYWDAQLKGAAALLIGTEATGLSDFWMNHDQVQTISIPLPGSADSLNAATSAAIVLFEALRKRSK